ncbi:hypothetical protein ISCGN_032252 [Ixodes scapularis]
MESAAACSSVDQNHQPHTANAEEEENDMRMLQDPPSTTGDDENDMAPWIKVTSRAIRRKTRASLATQTLNLSPPKPALRPSRLVLKAKPTPLPADDFKLAIRPRNGLVLSKLSMFAPGQETPQFEVPVPLQDLRKDDEHPGTNRNSAIYAASTSPPDVISLQETNSPARLPGYVTYGEDTGKNLHTLVSKRINAIQHALQQTEQLGILLELIPRAKKHAHSLFILNMYCRPKCKDPCVQNVLLQAIHKAGSQPLLIMGDFNAAHQLWGYAYSNKHGNALHALIANNDLTLLTNPASHTRMGNRVTNDTSPDLTITSHIPHADWEHLGEYLGSDHAILATTIYGAEYKVKLGKAGLTDWTKLRDEREKRLKTTDHSRLTLQDVQTHTTNIETSTTTPYVGIRLLHLWEARRSLIKRWKKQKLNRKLKKRIARLTEDAAQYASELCKENWLSLCDGMCGTLSTYKTWKLIRYLIDPAKSKTTSQHTMGKVIHQHVGDTRHLLATLKTRYLPTHPTEPLPPYSGSPNPLLDEEIHLHEVTDALAKIRRNTAPGLDQVTNKALANLDNPSLLELTDHLNDIWRTGILPEDWKTAEVKLIPKPNKPPNTDNLRPISLTSCAGKLLEHIVLNRLQSYIEDHDKLPVTMFGFRSHLSTQDVLLQLKEEVMLPATRNSPTAILALDLKGAFDNVKHTAILSQLNTLDCGHRTYQYIKDFLSGRRAILKVGDLATDPVLLGSRGTPQGAVLSPLIFTIALIGLPVLLDSIPGVHHGTYADDITIWSGTGSFGEIEERLQTAADAVSDYAKSCGLQCAPQKSELLLISPRKKGSLDPANVTISMEGHIIVPSPPIKILGMTFQADRANTILINKLKHTMCV